MESVLACPAAVAFEAVLQPATFSYVSLGLLGMPAICGREEPFSEGERISGRLFLGNLVPMWVHEMHIVSIDREALQLVSHERGGAVSVWNHTVDLEPLDQGTCRLRDTVQIDAGPLTGIAAWWARVFYGYRHRRWHRLVSSWGYPPVVDRPPSTVSFALTEEHRAIH